MFGDCMLYIVSFYPQNKNKNIYDSFYASLNDIGKNRMLFEGAYLLDTALTVSSIRKEIFSHIAKHDLFIIAHLFREECAGKLCATHKDFINQHLWNQAKLNFFS